MKKDNPSKVIIVPHPPVPAPDKKSENPGTEPQTENGQEKKEETAPEQEKK